MKNRIVSQIAKKALKSSIIPWKLKLYLLKLGGAIFEDEVKVGCIDYCGKLTYLRMQYNSEINRGCFLLAKDNITIGRNSTLAYQVTILTSANPHGPHNKLSTLYPAMTAPVTIGNDVWVGAKAVILPGVTIGECSVVAAGAVVTKDVPPYTLVAGVPARVVKPLKI